jgi:multidrug efflux pump subunit AcrA (membrane-fusion protein)
VISDAENKPLQLPAEIANAECVQKLRSLNTTNFEIVPQHEATYFLVRVGILDQDQRDNRLRNKLLPGMAIRAEIKTGTRSIVSYLFEPVRASVDEAFRER